MNSSTKIASERKQDKVIWINFDEPARNFHVVTHVSQQRIHRSLNLAYIYLKNSEFAEAEK